tara:strand:- start:349 stop:1119 length:771 start_codon:yes stop_codon:yes gene_type:complete
MPDLNNKVAFITGAASGIGRASAIRMAADGASVMCSDLNEEAAVNTARIIEQEGGRATAIALDVTDGDAVESAIETTASRLGACQVIFNNAGVGGGPEIGWDMTIGVNLSGVYYGLRHGAAFLAENGGGVIINTASVAGLLGLALPPQMDIASTGDGGAAYVAAKHGVSGLTKQFALNYGPHGVRVNAIAPGFIETPMTDGISELPMGKEFMVSKHPLGRMGQPEDIAAAAAFLASDDAAFITGIVMPVDGGYSAQ